MPDKEEYIVYMHINKINNKKYIGITCQDAERRWRADGSGYIKNNHFYSAISKYGWDNFEHIILKTKLNKLEAESVEIELIAMHNTTNRKFGYNAKEGGGSNGRHTEETRRKISENNKRRPINWVNIRKMQQVNTGRKRSPEVGRKISEKLTGKKFSAEHRKKLSMYRKGRTHTEEHKLKISESVRKKLSNPEK